MKTYLVSLYITGSLICLFSCKKSSSPATLPISHWTINGVTDSSGTVSAANNTNFVCLTSDQLKSISINFLSAVTHTYTYKVANILNDSTECTLTVNDGSNQVYASTGNAADSVYETFSNHIITLTFNNISVHDNANTVLISGVLSFQSAY
jgi:hypothetical protein